LQGSYPTAMEYAKKAHERSPESLDTLYAQARINQQIGLHDDANRLYNELLSKDQSCALYWCSLAVLNYEQNQ
jgi:tetratricopeptide (TPR) repeat protein